MSRQENLLSSNVRDSNDNTNTLNRTSEKSSSFKNGKAMIDDDILQKQLTEEFLNSRNYFYDKSQLLFSLQQNYLKKLEDFKILYRQNKDSHRNYYDSLTSLALKDANLRYSRQILLDHEISWNNIFTEKLHDIQRHRNTLVSELQHYQKLRFHDVALLQSSFSSSTEGIRINTLNSITFCNYSKSIIENEIRKNYLINKLFQQKKEMMKTYSFYCKQVDKQKNELKEFQINKINILRRYERILLGKAKEYHAQQKILAMNLGVDVTSTYGKILLGVNENKTKEDEEEIDEDEKDKKSLAALLNETDHSKVAGKSYSVLLFFSSFFYLFL
jgi:hypothetical protein